MATFDKDHFIQDCRKALPQGQGAIRELVERACAEGEGCMRSLGAPEHAGVFALHRSPELTIINFVWAPYMMLMPHNHQMWAVIGVYSGREDNVFWRRKEGLIDPAGARSLGVGDVAALGRDTIHSVLNPIGKMTCAIHVYGGDFFAPPEPRSEWDHETLREQPWDIERVKTIFREAEERFTASRKS
jgi:predicted metal-dependent enzyme (double-stranded beta helix superfamily)